MCNQYEMELCRLTQHASAGWFRFLDFNPTDKATRSGKRSNKTGLNSHGNHTENFLFNENASPIYLHFSLKHRSSDAIKRRSEAFLSPMDFSEETQIFLHIKYQFDQRRACRVGRRKSFWRAPTLHVQNSSYKFSFGEKLDVEKLNLWMPMVNGRGEAELLKDAWVWEEVAEPVISCVT